MQQGSSIPRVFVQQIQEEMLMYMCNSTAIYKYNQRKNKLRDHTV